MKQIFLSLILFVMLGCTTPSKVQKDYERAEAHDRRAQTARDNGDLGEAKHQEKEAEKAREHKTSNVVVGAVVEAIIGEDEESESGAWQ